MRYIGVSVIAEIVNQVTKRLLPELTTHVLSELTRVKTTDGQNTALLRDNRVLHQASQGLAANGAQLSEVKEGSIVFVVRFQSKEDLQKFWQAYTTGTLARDITRCLVTSDLERQAGCKLTVQINIQESMFKKGLDVLGMYWSVHSYNSQSQL